MGISIGDYHFILVGPDYHPDKLIPQTGKSSQTGMASTAEFEWMDEISHILHRPAAIGLGDLELETKAEYVYDQATDTIRRTNVVMSPCLNQCLREALTNTNDCYGRSRLRGIEPGPFLFDITPQWIRLKNGGAPMPVAKHHIFTELYTPTVMFSKLRAGTNLNDKVERKTAGANGIGVKLLVIFSKAFHLTVVDATRGLRLTQSFWNNLSQIGEPVIEPSTEPSSVEIQFELDFPRFGLAGFSPELIGLYMRNALEVAVIQNTQVIMNGVMHPQKSLTEYVRYYFPTENIVSHVDPENSVVLCYVDTPGRGLAMSYANGCYTPDKGVHVKVAMEEFVKVMGLHIANKRKKPVADTR